MKVAAAFSDFADSCWNLGPMTLHGPHQVAKKSTIRSCDCALRVVNSCCVVICLTDICYVLLLCVWNYADADTNVMKVLLVSLIICAVD